MEKFIVYSRILNWICTNYEFTIGLVCHLPTTARTRTYCSAPAPGLPIPCFHELIAVYYPLDLERLGSGS